MTRARLRAALALACATAALAPAAAAQAASTTACRTTTATVVAGATVALHLDCRTGTTWRARGRTAGVARTIVAEPLHGTLSRLSTAAGTVRYRAARGFAGTDVVRFRVRSTGAAGAGSRRPAPAATGTIRITVTRPASPSPTIPAAPTSAASTTPPTAAAEAEATPAASDDTGADPAAGSGSGSGSAPVAHPDPLPLATASVAFGARNWVPTAQDTCPKALHESYAVIGPDGKKYPTWHPAVVTDPATGRTCTFGHEHGLDPRGSKIFRWVADHLATPGEEDYAGIPFGLATEALDGYAADHAGTPTRQEDHVGYKIDYENDVPLLSSTGVALGVTCDYLTRVHQGSHSADATSNNVHELLYAMRCSDGTQLISDTIARFGNAGQYTRSCDTATTVATTDNGYPDGIGSREIPDRTCMLTTYLVPASKTTSDWALYEKWATTGELRTADGAAPLATFDAGFGVFNPSRYADPTAASKLQRSIGLCWETEANGDQARGKDCDTATAGGTLTTPLTFDAASSPFNGTHRDVYLQDTTVRNGDGPQRWYTDPYGGNASTTPFPGAVCQLIGNVDNSAQPDLQQRVFGRSRTNDARGVHAPN